LGKEGREELNRTSNVIERQRCMWGARACMPIITLARSSSSFIAIDMCLIKFTSCRIKLRDRTRISETPSAEKLGMSRRKMMYVQHSGVSIMAKCQNGQTEARDDGFHSSLDRQLL
jgi:hypothetical protein